MLLMVAFTKDVVDMVRIDILRERLEYLIDKRFRGDLLRCETVMYVNDAERNRNTKRFSYTFTHGLR